MPPDSFLDFSDPGEREKVIMRDPPRGETGYVMVGGEADRPVPPHYHWPPEEEQEVVVGLTTSTPPPPISQSLVVGEKNTASILTVEQGESVVIGEKIIQTSYAKDKTDPVADHDTSDQDGDTVPVIPQEILRDARGLLRESG